MSSSRVPLVIAFTPNYLIPAATCLLSVLKCSGKADKYEVICLLTEHISDDYKQKLQSIDSHGQFQFSFINLQDRLKDVSATAKYTIAASYRLLAPVILPGYDKVIYLDCDMIIRNNLAELYHSVNLKDNFFAAVFEAPISFQLPYIQKLGLAEGSGYFNSGFLVMNLTQLRKEEMVDKFINLLKSGYFEFPDQDVLNILSSGRTLGLPPYYNAIRTFYLPQYKKFFLQRYSANDWEDVVEKGNIHYTGGKPWNQFTVKFKEWWDYFMMLPEAIKKGAEINKNIFYLYKFHKTYLGNFLIINLQRLYRKFK